MTLRIGTATLTVPRSVDLEIVEARDVGARLKRRQYRVAGNERGATAAAQVAALEKSLRRYGAMWCEDDEASIVAGYYAVEPGAGYVTPGGANKQRHWGFTLKEEPYPSVVTRQAEDDNEVGTDTAESTADEGFYVSRSISATISVLRPRVLGTAEDFNLPVGRWRCTVQARALASGCELKWLLTDLAGTTLATGAAVAVPATTGFQTLDLGVLSVPEANHLANWYQVQATLTGGSVTVHIDLVRFAPV